MNAENKVRQMKQFRLFSDILDAKLAILQADAEWNGKDDQRHMYKVARLSLANRSARGAIEYAYEIFKTTDEFDTEDWEAARNVWRAARDAARAVEINYADVLLSARSGKVAR